MARFGSLEGLRRNITSLKEQRGANPYLEFGTTAPSPPGSVGGNIGGLGVTTESATQIGAVYGCAGLLADSIASLPLRVLDRPPLVATTKELDVPPLLKRPYELISRTDWIVQCVWSLALRGNFFGLILERDRLGYPTQIMPVNPDVVVPRKKWESNEVEWYFAGNLIPIDDVFHVRFQSMPGDPLGLNPIQVCKYPFGLAHVQDVYGEKAFANDATPGGYIKAKVKITPESARTMAAGWASKHQGVNLSRMPGVLDEDAEFVPITVSLADLQLLESRKWSAEEICGMVFRVPPRMLGMTERSTHTGKGIEEEERTFVTNTLSGYLTRMEEALSECVPRGQWVNFDTHYRTRGNAEQRANVAYKMILAGSWVGDDGRALFDMPPLPNGEGKIVHSPTNSELLEMQLEELKKLEAEPDKPPPPTIVAPPTNGKGPPQNVPVPTK